MAKTLVTFLLDKSGSMASIRNDTVNAFNSYLDGLRQAKDVTIDFTLVQFDTLSIEKTCVAVPVASAPNLNDNNYKPNGGTPLIDAAYKTIKAVEGSVGDNKETKVVICIQTDGEENSSVEYSWNDLNQLIKEKTGLGWEFNFMGASIDAYAQGSKMGIAASHTVSYNSLDAAATSANFLERGATHVAFAAGQLSSTRFSPSAKMAAGDTFDPALKQPKPASPQYTPKIKPTRKQIVDDFKL